MIRTRSWLRVTDADQGAVGISNYPEFAVEDECLWRSEGESFADQVRERFAAGHPGAAAWAREYSWQAGKCDPCPEGGELQSPDAREVGWDQSLDALQVTRLHVRYDRLAEADLMLYASGIHANEQLRYIRWLEELGARMRSAVTGG